MSPPRTRSEFSTSAEYVDYVVAHVRPRTFVRCVETVWQVTQGDTGVVREVLGDLLVVDWQRAGLQRCPCTCVQIL